MHVGAAVLLVQEAGVDAAESVQVGLAHGSPSCRSGGPPWPTSRPAGRPGRVATSYAGSRATTAPAYAWRPRAARPRPSPARRRAGARSRRALEVRDPRTGRAASAGCRCAARPRSTRPSPGAAKAAPGWARTSPGRALRPRSRRPARALRARAEEIAALQARESGKSPGDSLGGVEAGLGTLEQYAELGPLHRGRALQGGWDATDVMRFEPRGVVRRAHALERPGRDRPAGARRRAGHRQRRRLQADRAHPAVRRRWSPQVLAEHLPAGRAAGPARRRPHRRACWSRAPRSTRSTTSAPRVTGRSIAQACAPHRRARRPRGRRQGRLRRRRRRRPGLGRRAGRARRLRQRRADLRLRRAGLRPRRPSPRRSSPRWSPRPARARRGPARWSTAASATSWPATSRGAVAAGAERARRRERARRPRRATTRPPSSPAAPTTWR